jgi:hypothetical protein
MKIEKRYLCFFVRASVCIPFPQSNDGYRGTSELVQHFALRGSSHWRQGAASHVTDMVWLYPSPIPMGRRGLAYLTFSNVSTCLHEEEGGGNQHPVAIPLTSQRDC